MFEGGQIKGAVLFGGQDLELNAAFFNLYLPGNEVGVVFFSGDQHHIARPQVQRIGYQIDALGGVAGEDHFFFFGRTQKFCQLGA
ncbi:hypothetical protein SDC9_169313 [bioreactor metagenome]|uniref:Uncharacterized protein n=1 Tax=bioreactor metagenome TaxID=1076179 RepID=A0A645G4Y9_9ZZZZ